MKNLKSNSLLWVVALGLALNVNGQPAEEDSEMAPPVEETVAAPPVEAAMPVTSQEEFIAPLVEEGIDSVVIDATGLLPDGTMPETGAPTEPRSFIRQGTTPARFVAPSRNGLTNAAATPVAFNLDEAASQRTPPDQVVKDGEKGLRLNFDNAPLETVLQYLSDAAGFVIVPKVSVRGRISVMSSQPLDKDEAVALLGRVLAEEGYAVIPDGRTLTITTQAEAKKGLNPVKTARSFEQIPNDKQIATMIVPVRFINAAQLANDLAPLMAQSTTLTANQGGNALVITDTQENIRRLVEIVNAIDTSVSSLSKIRVFSLRFADAKTVATMIKDMFASTGSGGGGGGGGGGRGGRGGGGMIQFMVGGGGGQSPTSGGGRPGAAQVIATSDDRSNALVVSAPEDLMPTIELLVAAVDIDVTDITEIEVFKLQHSDPQETADLLTSLFPDPTSPGQGGRGGGGRGGMQVFGATAASATQSDRMKLQSKVTAVPDARTRSVVVTAAHETMIQIEKMITKLDADDAQTKKVYVFEAPNTDPTMIQQTLDDLFSGRTPGSSTRLNSRNTGTAGSQLGTRAIQQNTGRNTGRTGSTGFGGTGSTGTRTMGGGF